jgi:hypothetical protein
MHYVQCVYVEACEHLHEVMLAEFTQSITMHI